MKIVGFCVSSVHGDDDLFELLIAYSDGREVGHLLPRKMVEELSRQLHDYL